MYTPTLIQMRTCNTSICTHTYTQALLQQQQNAGNTLLTLHYQRKSDRKDTKKCACTSGRQSNSPRSHPGHSSHVGTSGAGIMEADDRQVTTVFTVQPSNTFGTRKTEYHEALPWSANDEVRCDCTFADDGNASYTRFVECPWWNDGWTVKNVVT